MTNTTQTQVLKCRTSFDSIEWIVSYCVIQEQKTIVIDSIYRYHDRYAFSLPDDRTNNLCELGVVNGNVEELTVYRNAIAPDGTVNSNMKFVDIYQVDNPKPFADYTVPNKAVITEVVLCMENNYQPLQEELYRIKQAYETGDYTQSWLNKRLNAYFKRACRAYEQEQLVGEDISTVCTQLELQKIFEFLVED